jgi:predicted CXXCH cytochrome family protein
MMLLMLLSVVAVFIGSQACRPCHAAIAESYAQTAMARSSGRVASISLPPGDFTAAGHRYRVGEGQLRFKELGDELTVSMDFFIGSATAGRSFIFMRDRYLFELPVTWYARKAIWDASPGYENETEVRLNRAVEPSCLFCHSSGVRPIFGTQNRYGDPPFLENGIGCERCHGPGSEHRRDPQHARMVNPAKLAPALRDSVCSQCHLTGDARIERAGRRIAEFRAGDDLSVYATYFVRDRDPEDLKVTGHVEKLAASECKRNAGDNLWCGTCHDPHAANQMQVTRDKTQAACAGCHPTAHPADKKRLEQNCADCHMPKSHVIDGGHGVLTDHNLSGRGSVPQSGHSTELTAFLGDPDDRSLGLAYAGLGDPRARAYLLRAKPADPEVRLRLASMETDAGRAAALYESVLRENPYSTVALVNLGSLYAGAGRMEEAGHLWERALDSNPAIEAAVLNLAQIKPPAEARVILQRYLGFNPGSKAARVRLAAIPSVP